MQAHEAVTTPGANDDARELLALGDAFFAAALDPTRWPEALLGLGRYVGRDDGSLVVVTFAEGGTAREGWALAGLRGAVERRYEVSGHPLFSLPGQGGAESPPVVAEASVGALAQLSLTREFLQQNGAVHAVTEVLHRREDLVSLVHVFRQASARSEHLAERLARARPQLTRALEVYARLRAAKRHAAIDRAQLDAVDVAALVVSVAGRVLRSNRAADALLAREDGLRAEEGVLRCEYPRAGEALTAALQEACAPKAAPRFRAVLVPRRTGSRPYLAFISRLDDDSPARDCATLLIRDADAHHSHDEILGQLFGLTPSEVRVALGIVRGDAPRDLALHLGLSIETVRSHLKRVFFKTATRNQADLVRLVLGECPVS